MTLPFFSMAPMTREITGRVGYAGPNAPPRGLRAQEVASRPLWVLGGARSLHVLFGFAASGGGPNAGCVEQHLELMHDRGKMRLETL
jgi:hypothetical protein